MHYLLVCAVPFGKGSSTGRFILGDMWLEDLRAQARAWRSYGRLGVAVPYVDQLTVSSSSSFNLVEIDPVEEGFDVFPLPNYLSMTTLLKQLPELRTRLHEACQWASIIQADYVGHPIALGQLVWSIAKQHNKKRIWLFDGADPFPRLENHAAEERNFLKRMVKKAQLRQFNRFCCNAISEADLVFTHNRSVIKRFETVWNDRCHAFDRSFVTKQILINDRQAASRQQLLLDASQPLRLVVASRQTAIKATDHVLKAMAKAVQRGANLLLDVIGDGDALKEYQQLTVNLGLTEKVRFLGGVPYGQPLFNLLQQAHVLLVTNLTAEISRNVLLGMALGVPLILYRNPGTDELIEDYEAGIVVQSNDIDALSTALLEADKNRARLAKLVTNGLKLARTRTLDSTHRSRAELAAACLKESPTPGVSLGVRQKIYS